MPRSHQGLWVMQKQLPQHRIPPSRQALHQGAQGEPPREETLGLLVTEFAKKMRTDMEWRLLRKSALQERRKTFHAAPNPICAVTNVASIGFDFIVAPIFPLCFQRHSSCYDSQVLVRLLLFYFNKTGPSKQKEMFIACGRGGLLKLEFWSHEESCR